MGDIAKKDSALFEKEIRKVEQRIVKSLKDRKPYSLYEPAAYIMQSGGKRLRPLLVVLSARAAAGGKADVYNAAAAVELLHNFTLVHDDIMDNADKRRGLLTLHKKYDINTAILAGDGLLSVAYEYLLKDCGSNAKEVAALFTKGLVEVCEGQSLDKEFETQPEVSLSDYLIMIQKKTAAMAEMCCSAGAVLGGGDKKFVKSMGNFGRNIGIAFQIQDDLLDIAGNETEFGKVTGGDLMEGKKTFLFITALNKAEGRDKEMLLKVIKNKGIKQGQIGTYKKLYERLNVLEDAEKEIRRYTEKALKSLNVIEDEDMKGMFVRLANSLIKRSK